MHYVPFLHSTLRVYSANLSQCVATFLKTQAGSFGCRTQEKKRRALASAPLVINSKLDYGVGVTGSNRVVNVIGALVVSVNLKNTTLV